MPGPRVLLIDYVARVISRGPGILSSFCHPSWVVFGSSELDWGSVELLRTYEERFSGSESALHPGLCLGWAYWGVPCCVIL